MLFKSSIEKCLSLMDADDWALQRNFKGSCNTVVMIFFYGTSPEGGEFPHYIIGRGEMVQLIREIGPKNHTSTVN
jgi:hypothetical protein